MSLPPGGEYHCDSVVCLSESLLLKDFQLLPVSLHFCWSFRSRLEVRVPFLDHCFVSYALSLPPETRCPNGQVEKYVLRKAFSDTGLVPNEILWRPKEGFSDGLASSEKPFYEFLKEHIVEKVSEHRKRCFSGCAHVSERALVARCPTKCSQRSKRPLLTTHLWPRRPAFTVGCLALFILVMII